jgi:hypothetical protein
MICSKNYKILKKKVCCTSGNILERIKNNNKTYFMLQNFFKNKNVSKKLKLILKNTTVDKMLTYASDT